MINQNGLNVWRQSLKLSKSSVALGRGERGYEASNYVFEKTSLGNMISIAIRRTELFYFYERGENQQRNIQRIVRTETWIFSFTPAAGENKVKR